MVSDSSTGSCESGFAVAGTRRGRAPVGCADQGASHEMFAATDARSAGISERLRRAFRQQISQGSSLRSKRPRWRKDCQLRTGRIADRNLWRQLKLARTGLVSDQLPADRIASAISPLLWRRFQGGIPHRFWKFHALERSRQRTFESPDQTLAARQKW